jgi:hypothetical protein
MRTARVRAAFTPLMRTVHAHPSCRRWVLGAGPQVAGALQVGSPRTHRKFLNREDGTYGPIPMRPPLGILNMPFNRTDIAGLFCAGDSTFPGQGVNAVVFSGFGAAHCALCELGLEQTWAAVDRVYVDVMDRLRYNT